MEKKKSAASAAARCFEQYLEECETCLPNHDADEDSPGKVEEVGTSDSL